MDRSLRDRISGAVTEALKPLPFVLAGWEGGSAAYGNIDIYSDIDLSYLAENDVSLESLYAVSEKALGTVSDIIVSHTMPLGRYYRLKDGGDFLFVDLIFFRVGDPDHHLDVQRHGHVVPLFDKAEWLRAKPLDEAALAARRAKRYRELQGWFVVSQSFVRKAILRGQHVEAVAAFWAYTLKPLTELLRMRYCPVRWDFGMRYLDRDLPPHAYEKINDLTFVRDLKDLETKLPMATVWGAALLKELAPEALSLEP